MECREFLQDSICVKSVRWLSADMLSVLAAQLVVLAEAGATLGWSKAVFQGTRPTLQVGHLCFMEENVIGLLGSVKTADWSSGTP